MLKVGITGGIGSGKSVVCKVFELLDIPVFNSDVEARQLMDTDQDVKSQVINLIGDEAYNHNGLNRAFLRNILFNNQSMLQKINNIVHPAVRRYFEEWCSNHSEAPYVMQEAAIIFESGAYKLLDYTITVYAPEKLRISRTVQRDATDEQSIKQIIKNQMSDKEKMEKSDFVINNYDPHLLIPQIIELNKKLVKLNSN